MGYPIRTEQFRYTEWRTAAGDVLGVELDDHHVDPREDINLAERANTRVVATRLSAQLKAGWRGAAVSQ
jgi:hypothetical protein